MEKDRNWAGYHIFITKLVIFNEKTGEYDAYNPTQGKGNKVDNIVDPQSWIPVDQRGEGDDASTNRTVGGNESPKDVSRSDVIIFHFKKFLENYFNKKD